MKRFKWCLLAVVGITSSLIVIVTSALIQVLLHLVLNPWTVVLEWSKGKLK